MNIIYLLLPLSILLGLFFLISFFWAVNKGQFDDLDTPAKKILFEDNKSILITKIKGEKK